MNIEAEFNYRKPLKENEAKPAYGLEEESEDNTLPDYLKAFTKTVHDARGSNFDITMGGFELINHISSVEDFYNDQQVVDVYYDEMSSYVKEKVGADTVQIFSHITRNEAQAESGERKGGHRPVASLSFTRFCLSLITCNVRKDLYGVCTNLFFDVTGHFIVININDLLIIIKIFN